MEMVENNFLELLVNFLLLTENDISLALNSRILKFGVLEYVADDIDGDWDVLAEALGVVNGLFTRGIRVQVCTKIFHFQLERVLVSATCSFESHMFQKVGRPIRFVGLCTRACVYPDTDSSGLCMWMGLCCNSKTVRECGCLGDRCWDIHSRCERPQGPLEVVSDLM